MSCEVNDGLSSLSDSTASLGDRIAVVTSLSTVTTQARREGEADRSNHEEWKDGGSEMSVGRLSGPPINRLLAEPLVRPPPGRTRHDAPFTWPPVVEKYSQAPPEIERSCRGAAAIQTYRAKRRTRPGFAKLSRLIINCFEQRYLKYKQAIDVVTTTSTSTP
jgi:hypothetical protein